MDTGLIVDTSTVLIALEHKSILVRGAWNVLEWILSANGLQTVGELLVLAAGWKGFGKMFAWLDEKGLRGIAIEIAETLRDDLVLDMKEATKDGKLTTADLKVLREEFASRFMEMARVRGGRIAKAAVKANLPRLQEWAVKMLKARLAK